MSAEWRGSIPKLDAGLGGCNRRYLEYLSSLDDSSAGIRALDRLTRPRPVKGGTSPMLSCHGQPIFLTLQEKTANGRQASH